MMKVLKYMMTVVIVLQCYQVSYIHALDKQIVIFNIQGINNVDKYSSVIEVVENMQSIESFMVFTILQDQVQIEVTALLSYNNILNEILQQEKFTIVKEEVARDLVYLDILLLADNKS